MPGKLYRIGARGRRRMDACASPSCSMNKNRICRGSPTACWPVWPRSHPDLSFAKTPSRGPSTAAKCRFTGNPMRRGDFAGPGPDAAPSAVYGGKKDGRSPFTVSDPRGQPGRPQPSIMRRHQTPLPRLDAPAERYYFIHQTGPPGFRCGRSKRIYNHLRDVARGRAGPFSTIWTTCYRRAHLVICRAGATTIAEITAVGKGCRFDPLSLCGGRSPAFRTPWRLVEKG